jgi:hypothetical protein
MSDKENSGDLVQELLLESGPAGLLDIIMMNEAHKNKITAEISEAEGFALHTVCDLLAELLEEKYGDPANAYREMGAAKAFTMGFAINMSTRIRKQILLSRAETSDEEN